MTSQKLRFTSRSERGQKSDYNRLSVSDVKFHLSRADDVEVCASR